MKNPCILIVGFMGSGKTTVAKELARQLSRDFIDLDDWITEREGRSPAEIIREDGESVFRPIETKTLCATLEDNAVGIIALGGGAWTIESNRALAKQFACTSIWLDSPFEVCWQRIDSEAVARPLAPDRERAQSLYETRRHFYAQGTTRVAAEAFDSTEEIAKRIVQQLVGQDLLR